jgi:hypothetical protein
LKNAHDVAGHQIALALGLVGLVAVLIAANYARPLNGPLGTVQRACDVALREARPELAAGAWEVESTGSAGTRARARVVPRDAGPKNRIAGTFECRIASNGRASLALVP